MFNSARPNDSLPDGGNKAHDISLHGAQLPVEQSDNNSWQTVHFPGTIAADQILGPIPHLRTNAMDSSSTRQSNSTANAQTASPEHSSQREAELLHLVRDLNECNDVLLAKVSQLEESLERSQAALQAEIDRSGAIPNGDREIVQLVTELEQSNQALQQHQMLNETLQTELAASRERAIQLETEHAALLQQNTAQSQELLQANTNCRDLRARLQRQQRYTLQFKAALEKCLSMSTEAPNSAKAAFNAPGIAAMPKTDEIRPWESTLGHSRLDPQLESMIRGIQTGSQPAPSTLSETEAEDQLWHDLARVMEPEEAVPDCETSETSETSVADEATAQFIEPSQFTEPSPWGKDLSVSESNPIVDESEDATAGSPSLSPQVSEILERVQSAQVVTATDTYLPAISAQGSPSPLVNPLKPQKRIGSLSAIDLPNFPRLKKQPPTAKA